jgi:acyl carrier protein
MREENLSEIVRTEISELCNTPRSKIDDTSDLFELGFDSILFIELIIRLEKRLGVVLSPKHLFVTPQVGAIVKAIVLRLADAE